MISDRWADAIGITIGAILGIWIALVLLSPIIIIIWIVGGGP